MMRCGRWVAMSVLLGLLLSPLCAEEMDTVETPLEQALVLDGATGRARDASAVAAAYRIAAEGGDAFAHLRLGYFYETGEGVPHDYAQARRHYEAAVAAGLDEARLRLAICHLEGWGGPADRAAFVREVQTAAEAGYLPAQKVFATMCFLGFGVPEDRAQGIVWLERAAALDDANAQLALGHQSERARRLALQSDLSLARSWYQLSAEKEYTEGMRALARTFLTGKRDSRDWATGQRWLLLAAESGDAEAPYILAVCELLHVDSQTQDVGRARRWLREASERGNMRATEILQLEESGRSLAAAIRYVLAVPFEERYVQKARVSLEAEADSPTRPPQVYRVVKPIYPQSLRMTDVEGKAVVDFVVDVTGRVPEAKVVEAGHPLFGERAVEAVRQWRFHPARRDGRIVNTRMRVPIFFNISAEQLDGVDGMMQAAMAKALSLGSEVAADAVDLWPASPISRLRAPRMPDGSAVPKGARGLLLLVVDEQGRAVRGHVLQADPETVGPLALSAALAQRYRPRILEGKPVAANVVLPYRFGVEDEDVFRMQ